MKKQVISIPDLDTETAAFKIRGITPLIVHKFGEKAIKQIENIQRKVAKEKRPDRNPKAEMEDSLHYFSDGKRTGFPAGGFKGAMIRAGNQSPFDYKMVNLATWFHVIGEEGLIEIQGIPTLRTDTVRLSKGGADIRYRPEYKKWEATLTIKFNNSAINKERIAQLINAAGFSCGIGEWRPSAPKAKNGSFGLFELI